MEMLRVNITNQTIRSEKTPKEYRFLGGRGLTSTLISKEVNATSDTLGPENKLVLAPGYLTATPLVNTGRLSLGGQKLFWSLGN